MQHESVHEDIGAALVFRVDVRGAVPVGFEESPAPRQLVHQFVPNCTGSLHEPFKILGIAEVELSEDGLDVHAFLIRVQRICVHAVDAFHHRPLVPAVVRYPPDRVSDAAIRVADHADAQPVVHQIGIIAVARAEQAVGQLPVLDPPEHVRTIQLHALLRMHGPFGSSAELEGLEPVELVVFLRVSPGPQRIHLVVVSRVMFQIRQRQIELPECEETLAAVA